MKRQFKEFANGLVEPSLPALAGTFLVALMSAVLCAWKITPQFFAEGAANYLMKNSKDGDLYLSSEVLRLVHSPPTKPALVAIGDSMMRESISSADDLRRDVLTQGGADVDVRLLVAGAVTQWEELAIADCLAGRVHGVVLLEVSPYNIATRKKPAANGAYQQRLAFTSNALDEEVRRAGVKVPGRWNNFFLDNWKFLAVRQDVLFHPMRPPVDAEAHPADRLVVWTDKQWQQKWKTIAGWVNTYEKNRDVNFEMYERMIHRLRESGLICVVLLEGVQSPRLDAKIQGSPIDIRIHAQYRQDMRQFAARQNVPYWDLREEANLRAEDFVDYAHITDPQARSRYTQVLAKHVAAIMGQGEPHGEERQ